VAVLAVGVAILVMATGGVALAVSDGNYASSRQHCSGKVDNSDHPKNVEPGCKNMIVSASDGNGNEFAWGGTQQTADGQSVDPTTVRDFRIMTPVDPASGVKLYMGADDNLDTGEHDSSEQANIGPSDGGGVQFNLVASSVATWLAALSAGDSQYLLTHPMPLIDAGFGECADGICTDVQTQRRVAWQGGGTGSRDLADYSGKKWDPTDCGGPDDQPKSCGGHPLSYWYNQDGTVYAEPGVTFFEDPDPEGSPIGPYPLPALYAGTCGVVAGGGPAATAPASPITNSAGQLQVKTGC
jgi:hypothetical protein